MKVAIDKAMPLIMEKEGFRSTPYKCSANHWTIGYGTLMVDMPKGTKSITEPEARKRLRARVERDWKHLRGAVDVELNVNQAAALLSLVYNIGMGAFNGSTLVTRHLCFITLHFTTSTFVFRNHTNACPT
jgi:lysozyme